MTRIESAYSINMFKMCPRKYYYRYFLKLPEKSGIAALNGEIVHGALEKFFTIDPERLRTERAYDALQRYLLSAFHEQWAEKIPQLALAEEKEEVKGWYEESLAMLENFFQNFTARLRERAAESSVRDAFVALKPETEAFFLSDRLQLRGYVDAIHRNADEVTILDYKTSRSDKVSGEYRLQLAIYALLFQEKFGRLPTKAGLYFLRHNTERFVEISQGLVDEAAAACEDVHAKTVSSSMGDYQKNMGSHCRFCDYQTVCFGQKTLEAFHRDAKSGSEAKALNEDVKVDLSMGR